MYFPVVGDITGRARRKTRHAPVGTDGIVATIDGLVLRACFGVTLIVVVYSFDLVDAALDILTDAILVVVIGGSGGSPLLLGIASGLFRLERRRVHYGGRKFQSTAAVVTAVAVVVVVIDPIDALHRRRGPRQWVDGIASIRGGWRAPYYFPSHVPRPLEIRPVVVVDYLQSVDAGQSGT
jgi:hypothetical protein